MDKRARTETQYRIDNWVEMRPFLDDMGFKGGCDFEPSYRSEGDSPSNRAMVAILGHSRRSGLADAAEVATALHHAKRHAPYQIALLIHKALYAGTEKQRLRSLEERGIYLDRADYVTHLTSALLLLETELRQLGRKKIEPNQQTEECYL